MTLDRDVLKHPTLKCSIRGTSTTSTVQFRGLKYASIPARYEQSTPNDVLVVGGDGYVDATQFGPSCPHKREAQAWDLTLTGDIDLPCKTGQGETEVMDEFDCLHLNITVPRLGSLSAERQHTGELPVFVWVHGGGLSMGANSWPQYDLRRFVERSVEIGKPVVGVSINYRHGIFGFLASEEIGAEGNMGYKDQVLAFRWIKNHISGFGGDPHNVTAAGESAGGISLSTLLCANIGEEGLFERVVVMSGDTTLRKPRDRRWQRQMYEEQAKHLNVELRSLRNTLLDSDAEELAQRLPLAQHFCGTIDGQWLKEVSLNTLMDRHRIEHKPSWCKDFVIGDAAHDGTVLKARILDQPQALDQLKKACHMFLSESKTHRLLTAYRLIDQLAPAEETNHLRELASELRFHLPTLVVHRGWKTMSPRRRASRYHFHVPNPLQGATKGLASHELDVVYLLQNFNGLLDRKNRKIAEQIADRFIGFTHGDGWAKEGNIVLFGQNGLLEVNEKEYDEIYRSGRGNVLEDIGAQKLWHVAEAWQGVRKDDHVVRGNL